MRRALVLGLWLAAGAFAALQVLLVLDVPRPLPLDLLWAFVPQLFLPAWLVLVGAGVSGARGPAAVAVAVCIAHVALILPPASGSPDAVPPGATRLRVVTANLFFDNDRLDEHLAELRSYDADVVVLQEVTHAAAPAIVAALSAAYPEQAMMARAGGFGGAIFSRYPVVDDAVVDLAGLPMLTVVLDVDGRRVRVWDVHTRSPALVARTLLRDTQLDLLAELRRQETLPLVAAGDYNATYWNVPFARLTAAGLRDAHDALGRGLAGSWKVVGVEPLLDHVLVSDEWAVIHVFEGSGPGSDHRPVVADLALLAR